MVIARGGRYDDLVRRCGAIENEAFGVGFSLAIDPIRELINELKTAVDSEADVLVAFSSRSSLESAMARQRHWHQRGRGAVMALRPLNTRTEAQKLANEKGGLELDWIDP